MHCLCHLYALNGRGWSRLKKDPQGPLSETLCLNVTGCEFVFQSFCHCTIYSFIAVTQKHVKALLCAELFELHIMETQRAGDGMSGHEARLLLLCYLKFLTDHFQSPIQRNIRLEEPTFDTH